MMSEREKLLRQYAAWQFAAWDTDLFLNTHPHDTAALSARRAYLKKAEELKNEYTQKYGMLTHTCPETGNCWNWVTRPWPWEKAGRNE